MMPGTGYQNDATQKEGAKKRKHLVKAIHSSG